MKSDGTYEYGLEDPKLDISGVMCPEQVSSFAYFPTFEGLVTYQDTSDTTKTIVTKYEFQGGKQEVNWLPKLNPSTIQTKAIKSSTEIFVLNRNFTMPEKRKKMLEVLEHLAPSLESFLDHIRVTDPDAKDNFNRLLVDDMFNFDEKGTVLFLRLGKKVLCQSAISEERVPMINRTRLYRLNTASGLVLKYVGKTGDYSLDNEDNWEK